MADERSPIEATVEVEVADYAAMLERSPVNKAFGRTTTLLGVVLGALVVVATIGPSFIGGDTIGLRHVPFFVVAGAVVIIGMRTPAIVRRANVQRLAAAPESARITGIVRLTFDDRGITSHTRTASTWHAWEVVSGIDETPTHVFVTVGEHRVFILPRWSFRSTVAWEELADEMRSCRHDAVNYFPACPECGFDLTNLPTHGCPECGWERDAYTTRAA
jgi:predicted RNA-binding Zn-ribbon protein involved in translation (DUF1610 family)